MLKNWAEILGDLTVVQLLLVIIVLFLNKGVLEGDGWLCFRGGKWDWREFCRLNWVVWKGLEGEGGGVDRADEGLGPRTGACRECTWCSCWGGRRKALGLPGWVMHLRQRLLHQGKGCGRRAVGVRGGGVEEWDPCGVVVGGRGVGRSCGCWCMGGEGRVGIGYMSWAVTIGWSWGRVLVIWGGTGGSMVRGWCWGAMEG